MIMKIRRLTMIINKKKFGKIEMKIKFGKLNTIVVENEKEKKLKIKTMT